MIKYQKVIKVGNSLAVTLDKDFVAQAAIAAGQQIAFSYSHDTKSFSGAISAEEVQSTNSVREQKKAYVTSQITQELENWTESFLEENAEALDKLSKL